jgi:hypothetical protein
MKNQTPHIYLTLEQINREEILEQAKKAKEKLEEKIKKK